MIFDSHAHYDDAQFEQDRDLLLKRLHSEERVGVIVNIAEHLESSKAGLALSNKYSFIYAAIGVHPNRTKEMKDEDIDELRQLAKSKKVVAIGEIGLDYHYDFSPKGVQKMRFIQQLDLAKELKLPVVIHSREALQDTFDILIESKITQHSNCVIHAYSGSPEMAQRFVENGYHIGVGGVLTFKNSKKLVETVKEIPLENILIETDAPYLTPSPFRGKRNDSGKLVYVIEKIAELKGIEAEKVEEITYENGKKFYGL